MFDESVAADSVQLWIGDQQIACKIEPIKEQDNNSSFSNTYQLTLSEAIDWNTAELKTTTGVISYAGVSADESVYACTKEPLSGDVNLDGEVSMSDAVLLSRIANENVDDNTALTRQNYMAADYDNDERITILDVTKLLTFLSQQSSEQ